MTSEQQKKLGAYYTPEQVTDCLSAWAIRSPSDSILEPSFGGCNFLTSSINVLYKLGSKTPYENIHGFDIDPAAFKILEQKQLNSPNFILGDFLNYDYKESIQVNVILGNPPYLPVRKLQEDYKKKLFEKFLGEFKVDKRSSLWIYFIVHSFRYLSIGGRMAWVVPDSIAFTEYGKKFLKQISRLFTSVKVFRIEERFFTLTGTKEKTSFLFCEGFKQGSCTHEEINFKFLVEALENVLKPQTSLQFLGTKQEKKVATLKDNFTLAQLGDIFHVKIGIVIGATNLLVFSEEDAEKTPFHPKYTYPIITKGKQIESLYINREKLRSRSAHLPLYIINGIELELKDPELFARLINSIPNKVLLNKTFKKRTKLFGYDDYLHPDAFLTFYAQKLPKFSINKDKELNCTNSVHRLYLRAELDSILIKFIAIQFFSSFFSNEIRHIARPYGNSIHKFEPSDANKIPVIIPNVINNDFKNKVESCIETIEKFIEINKVESAKKLARSFVEDFFCYLP